MGYEECFWKRLFVVWKRFERCLDTKFRVTSKRCGEGANVLRQLRCTKLSGTDFVHRVGTACSYCMCHLPRQSRWDAWTNGPPMVLHSLAKVCQSIEVCGRMVQTCKPVGSVVPWQILGRPATTQPGNQEPRALSCFAYFLVFAIQGHSIWCLDMLSGFRLVPGSSWIWTNSQGAGWALFHVSSFLGDGLYNLSKVPCSELAKLCRALCRALGESGESGERYKQTYNLKTGVVRSCELRYDMHPGSTTPRARVHRVHRLNRAVWVSMKPTPKWLHMRRCKEWHQLQNGWTCFL